MWRDRRGVRKGKDARRETGKGWGATGTGRRSGWGPQWGREEEDRLRLVGGIDFRDEFTVREGEVIEVSLGEEMECMEVMGRRNTVITVQQRSRILEKGGDNGMLGI